MHGKIFTTFAVTGPIYAPTMWPYLSKKPEAIAAREAGSSIVRLHAGDPPTGVPTPDSGVFIRLPPPIPGSYNAGVDPTAGGGRGHAREGREDTLFLSWRMLAKRNAERVAKSRGILEDLSLDIAAPDEAPAMLALKSRDRVEF